MPVPKIQKLPRSAKDLPASMETVNEVRNELVACFYHLDAKIAGMDAKFTATFAAMDSKFTATLEDMKAMYHRQLALAEEQRSENRIMYEVLVGMRDRMDRVETRQDQTDEFLRSLPKRST